MTCCNLRDLATRLLIALCIASHASNGFGADHGVVLLYHHVGEDTPRSTSVTESRFDEHLRYLAAHDFRVWPLARLAQALQAHQPVPENVVALTFDDAYVSVLKTAAPKLKARGWPFTVFVNTQAVDDGTALTVSWTQLAELMEAGADIGNHSRSHAHLVYRAGDESREAWRARVQAETATGDGSAPLRTE